MWLSSLRQAFPLAVLEAWTLSEPRRERADPAQTHSTAQPQTHGWEQRGKERRADVMEE